MFKFRKFTKPDDCFLDLNNRREKGVYFFRINAYNESVKNFIKKYYNAARLYGVVIEGKIPNPGEKNLSYYGEIMGMDFQMSIGFIGASLKKWLPRMNDYQNENVSAAIYDTLDMMRKEGKNDNMLRNAYIKFMCWLYYKFERIVNMLGENRIPKILYEGQISNYELKLITVLAKSGCDVVLLQYAGDQSYLKLDQNSVLSYALEVPGLTAFPAGFSVESLRKEEQAEQNTERLYGVKPKLFNCTNAWIKGKPFDDVKTDILSRGSDPALFYNCFIRVNGVEDKLTYANDLYQLQLELKNNNRKLLIVENTISPPTPDEINGISRGTFKNIDQLLMVLSSNIKYSLNIELQRLMNKAFIDIILEESKSLEINLNKLTNKAVYLLCWLKRYISELFPNWKSPEIGCFIYLGGCKNENESMFLRLLSKLPTDVLILNPNLNNKCYLADDKLYELNYTVSLNMDKYPTQSSNILMGTAAYHAERELDTLMYQDSGMYRNKQYNKANSITLQTMYEEIAILWNQEATFRPNFSVTDSVVNVPVIFAKVAGIKDGDVYKYWGDIKTLVTDNTLLITAAPYIESTYENPVKQYATEFYKNGRLLKNKIKEHKCYQYAFLREQTQNHILDKLHTLIEQKLIKGTFENGTEYTIISVALNLNTYILRMIQKYDFTKKNPKIVYLNTRESFVSLEDSILLAFLNLIGFDIVLFVPTGYQIAEKYYSKQVMEEHQIGDYVYDLQPPNFASFSTRARPSWRDKLFRRGGS